MKRKTFSELAGNKLRPVGHILRKFEAFADMRVDELFGGAWDLKEELLKLHDFNRDASVYEVARVIHEGYTPLSQEGHELSTEDLNACRLMFYLVAAAVKRIKERTSEVLADIDQTAGPNRLQKLADYYRTGVLVPLDEKEYVLNGSKSCYAMLFGSIVKDLDGSPDTEWTADSLPKLDSCDIFYMRGVAALLNMNISGRRPRC